MPAAVVRELGHPGSRSPFDRPICIARELAFTVALWRRSRRSGTLDPFHANGHDVLLAIVAGGLRSWLGDSGHCPRILCAVPVSLHHRR